MHVTLERACCHKRETNVKCLMLLTIVHAVADAAFVGDDCVDTVFTCNYHVWRALCVISASVCVGTPKYTVLPVARTDCSTVTDPSRCEFIAPVNTCIFPTEIGLICTRSQVLWLVSRKM
jgi:hypothetical protein